MPAPIRFPTADELPAELRVDASAYENRWLCDGQVRTWSGESIASPHASHTHCAT